MPDGADIIHFINSQGDEVREKLHKIVEEEEAFGLDKIEFMQGVIWNLFVMNTYQLPYIYMHTYID